MSQFGIFGEDLGEYGNMDAEPDMLGQDAPPTFSDLITSPQTPVVSSQPQTFFQNAPAPTSTLRKALPWLIGGLAIAAVATVVIYSQKKATANEGEDEEDESASPNFAPSSSTKMKKAKTKTALKRCPVGTEVQTLILSADKFDEREAISWARSHRFSVTKVDETENSFRIRQHNPSRYKTGSFRTITLAPGIKGVIGCPKRR